MTKNLNGFKIISLLKELDRHVAEPCRIIICGCPQDSQMEPFSGEYKGASF